MNKYEQINYDELEELSVNGGLETQPDDPNFVITLSIVTKVISAITAITGSWAGLSSLYSCSDHNTSCK